MRIGMWQVVLLSGGAGLLLLVTLAICAMRQKQMHLWIGSYVRQCLRAKTRVNSSLIHIAVCIVDHFEPAWNGASYEQECARVKEWVTRYPLLANKHRDAQGRPPQHTFFFPEEEYRSEHIETLVKLCQQGYGDVEIHLHHDSDTAEKLREKLVRFKTILHEKHGLLHINKETGEVEYGFIHGNWALDNSGKHGKWCGVNNELQVLSETGCYADFTFPSSPSETQPRKINSIYYAKDNPLKPKSYDTGVDVKVGTQASGDLMIIQGPLTFNWKSRKWGIAPRIENGELSSDNPPTPERVDLWIRQHIHVKGQPNWIFVKLHSHGVQENNIEVLLGQPMDDMLSYLETNYNDGIKYQLHYVTAKELYDLIKALENAEASVLLSF